MDKKTSPPTITRGIAVVRKKKELLPRQSIDLSNRKVCRGRGSPETCAGGARSVLRTPRSRCSFASDGITRSINFVDCTGAGGGLGSDRSCSRRYPPRACDVSHGNEEDETARRNERFSSLSFATLVPLAIHFVLYGGIVADADFGFTNARPSREIIYSTDIHK